MTRGVRLAALLALPLVVAPALPRVASAQQAPPPAAATAYAPATLPPVPAATAGQQAAAVAINVFRVPGKTLLCGLGTLTAGGLLLITFGTGYRPAGAVFEEGCGGKWVIGPGDLDRNVEGRRALDPIRD